MSTLRSHFASLVAVTGVIMTIALFGHAYATDSVALDRRWVQGAALHVITADLADPRIRIDIGLPAKGLSHSESFANMIRRRGPLAAVTGTYFDTRSLLPVGTIVIGGKTVHVNYIGTTVCFLGSNLVRFVPTGKGESCDLSGTICGLRTGPRLLASGHYVLNPAREGFRHPGLFGRHVRVAMGVTGHNKLLLVAVHTPVTFARLASIMKALGAQDAVCLDGGSSSAMYYRGRLIRRPGRALTNIIEVYWNPAGSPANAEVATISQTGVTISAAPGPEWLAFWSAQEESAEDETLRRSERGPLEPPIAYEQAAVFTDSALSRFAKGRHAFFPVDRAQLSSLKRRKYPEHLVHVAADVQIVHHLVA